MARVLENVSKETIEVAHSGNHVVFEPGETKSVSEDFPETKGLKEVSGEKVEKPSAPEKPKSKAKGAVKNKKSK